MARPSPRERLRRATIYSRDQQKSVCRYGVSRAGGSPETIDADARSTDSGLVASSVIRNDGRQPRKEAGSPPRRRAGPSPTRAQRVAARAGIQGAITMPRRLTRNGANSRQNHFYLNRASQKNSASRGSRLAEEVTCSRGESTGQTSKSSSSFRATWMVHPVMARSCVARGRSPRPRPGP